MVPMRLHTSAVPSPTFFSLLIWMILFVSDNLSSFACPSVLCSLKAGGILEALVGCNAGDIISKGQTRPCETLADRR